MRGRTQAVLLAALAACAFSAVTVGQASAATLEKKVGEVKTPFLAIYGYPPETQENAAKEKAIGGGLGRNFGFGENMLFEGCSSTTCIHKIGTNLSIELENKDVVTACDSFVGGTLMSNKTGENNPVSFSVQFADFQCSELTPAKVKIPTYSDTSDRPWIAEICSPSSEVGKCKTDPLFNTPAGSVKIEDVSLNIGAPASPLVVQGTVWGIWNQGKAKEPPCITLSTEPPAGAGANQNLVVTQAPAGFKVGEKVIKYAGKVCLITANNDWTVLEEPEIVLSNT